MELSAEMRWSLVMRDLRLSEMILRQKTNSDSEEMTPEAAQLSSRLSAINLQASEMIRWGSMYPLKLNLRLLETG